ncbi:MAG TPA: hypothetical protein VNX25_01130, partial [Verrucomicrobiae bacterium]|nr:hypothetical protein [Verrucomicrobiae bacterium]
MKHELLTLLKELNPNGLPSEREERLLAEVCDMRSHEPAPAPVGENEISPVGLYDWSDLSAIQAMAQNGG